MSLVQTTKGLIDDSVLVVKDIVENHENARVVATEWFLNDSNAHLAPATVGGLANAVCEVLEQPALAQRLISGGLESIRSTDWAKESSNFAIALESINIDSS